ncbi:MAG TPA: hypothetical protein VFP34_18005 [Microlunatus sp.]|nr:hypothetical protein [Microlunatus sp.]
MDQDPLVDVCGLPVLPELPELLELPVLPELPELLELLELLELFELPELRELLEAPLWLLDWRSPLPGAELPQLSSLDEEVDPPSVLVEPEPPEL